MVRKINIDNIKYPSNNEVVLSANTTSLNWVPGLVKVANVQVANSTWELIDDTAVDTAGGYIIVNGSGFTSNSSVLIGTTSASAVTFVSSTQLRVQVPAQSAGTYALYVVNSDGATAIRVNALNYSGFPAWSTTSPLPDQAIDTAISIQLSASGANSYTLQAGSSLPANTTLASNGLFSGTVTGISSETTYSFTVEATDTENQNTPRTFSVTVTVGDPYFYTNTLLLSADGSNNANNNTFIDSSTNAFTITRNGNSTQGSFSPFSRPDGRWSVYFPSGVARTCLNTASSYAFDLGTSDFTYEAWFYADSATASVTYPRLFGLGPYFNSSESFGVLLKDPDNNNYITVYFSAGTLGRKLISTVTCPYNQWCHLAVVRSGSNFALFLNGSRIATFTSSAVVGYGPRQAFIGSTTDGSGNEGLVGYVSNVRFILGTAVYNPTLTTYTVPTAPLTAITNTQLLTTNRNRFIDSSTNALALTVTGSPSVQVFNPFNPTAAYSTSTNGGSAYFDGTGDMLETPSITIGTNPFCFECWFFPSAAQGNVAGFFVADTNSGLQLSYYSGNAGLGFAQKGVAWQLFNNNGIIPIAGQWNHIAFVRSGTGTNQASIFLNGVRIVNGTISFDYVASVYEISTTNAGGTVLQGYMSGARLTIGSSPYDATQSTITLPTAPPTAISNTSLLLNFTNAAITDRTAMNVLETVGDARISTAQSKFGGSSMYFDGTGDRLQGRATPEVTFGTGDFTVEGWLYLNSVPALQMIFDQRPASTNGAYPLLYMNGAAMTWYVSSADRIASSSLSTGTWYHFAVSRSGTSTKMFINGTQAGSTYTDSTNYLASNLYIGASAFDGGGGLNGYIDDFRITKGYARYTTNFTPPTSAHRVR